MAGSIKDEYLYIITTFMYFLGKNSISLEK